MKKRTIQYLLGIVFAVILFISAIFWINPPIEIKYKKYYEQVMLNLNQPEVINHIKANITAYFTRSDNFTIDDLFEWENHYMTFVTCSMQNRSTDPCQILEIQLGKCREFSILFASACVSTGIDVRLLTVVDVNYSANGPHAFNEVRINGAWVPVDASWTSHLVFNDTSIYEVSDWWSLVGKDYRIYAFDKNGVSEDVTCKYVK